MTRPVYKPSVDELNNFVAASLVLSVAFMAFKDVFSLGGALTYIAISGLVILSRELGQRTVAHWMEAESELNFSIEGAATTLISAIISFLTQLPVIALFPVFNSHDIESYEHWGKSIDAMWLKRKYWIVSSGVVSMLSFWLITNYLQFSQASEAISLFLIFQLLPFNYSKIPTGPLDGSVIIRWSGFMWIVFMGIAILSLLAV